jgi:hypothetical protein
MTDCVGHDPEPKITVSPDLVVRHGHGAGMVDSHHPNKELVER